jgi:tRNA-binding protein
MNQTELQSVSPYQAFQAVEMRVGRILRAEINERAKKPAYKLWIDFGP